MTTILLWLLALAALTTWSDGAVAGVTAVALTVAVGALVDRWWMLLVPPMLAVPHAAIVLDGTDADVLHYDADFDAIAEVTGQPCRWVVSAGSVS